MDTMDTMDTMDRSGFSLVELSIVLVILGLLTGGVLTGQSLIRAAELRSVTSEVNEFKMAYNTFKGKYFSIPGDMPNAPQFWPVIPTTGAQRCDGVTLGFCDGGGEITSTGGYENLRAWQEFSLSGLLQGNYTGEPTGNVLNPNTIDTNIPSSKIGGGWDIFRSSISNNKTHVMLGNIGTDIQFNTVPVLSSEEMWNLDKKTDDGLPDTGSITSFNGTGASNCVDAGDYDLDSNGMQCVGQFYLE